MRIQNAISRFSKICFPRKTKRNLCRRYAAANFVDLAKTGFYNGRAGWNWFQSLLSDGSTNHFSHHFIFAVFGNTVQN
jgi:hypothetical protein